MYSTIRKYDMDFPSVDRLFGGFRLRSVSRIVLIGWVLMLLLCAFVGSPHGRSEAQDIASASHFSGHPDHGHEVQQAGDCCTVFDSATSPTHQYDFSLLTLCLFGVLFFGVVGTKIIYATSSPWQRNSTGPPANFKHALIANCLWPNAPPL